MGLAAPAAIAVVLVADTQGILIPESLELFRQMWKRVVFDKTGTLTTDAALCDGQFKDPRRCSKISFSESLFIVEVLKSPIANGIATAGRKDAITGALKKCQKSWACVALPKEGDVFQHRKADQHTTDDTPACLHLKMINWSVDRC